MQSKFDSDRAGEYAVQSRIALVGYDACHELSACLLAASLGRGGAARVLVAGVGGTAREIIVAGQLEPGWRFTAVDPSAPMLELARRSLSDSAMEDRADPRLGAVDDLPEDPRFDAAMLIGVLHHLRGREAKLAILQNPARRRPAGRRRRRRGPARSIWLRAADALLLQPVLGRLDHAAGSMNTHSAFCARR